MSPSPKRHGAPPESRPPAQVLAIPQEIMDLIMVSFKSLHLASNGLGHLDKEGFIWDIKTFRLVCRTFNLGVFPWFAEQLSTSTFVFRLDESGIDDIVHLSHSPLAPCVQQVRLADRTPSPHILTLSSLGWTDPAREALQKEWNRHHNKKNQAAQERQKLLLVTNLPFPRLGNSIPVKEHHDRSTPSSLLRDPDTFRYGVRHHRQRDAFEHAYAGWRPTWEPYTCQYLRQVTSPPSEFYLSQLATAFSIFTNLQDITTDKAYEVHCVARDYKGDVVDSTSLHGEYDCFDYTGGRKIQCSCKDNDSWTPKPDYRCDTSTREIIWPAIFELGLLVDAVEPSRLSFLSTLKELKLNIYDRVAIAGSVQIISRDIAKFISHCQGLHSLELQGKTGDAIANEILPLSHKIVPAVQGILLYLCDHEVHFPNLLKITLREINADTYRHRLITSWLAAHRATLTEVALTIDFSAHQTTKKELNCWLFFLETIAATQRIRWIVLRYSFRSRHTGSGGQSLRLDCHRSWMENCGHIQDMFKDIVVRLNDGDSGFMGLEVWCTNQSTG